MSKIRVGITPGDINGISLEVILKGLSNPMILERCTPVIYGSTKVLSYHKNIVKLDQIHFHNASAAEHIREGKINVINCWQEDINIELGQMTEAAGKFAYVALDRCTEDLKAGSIDVMVTGPINKKSMQMANFPHAGHTPYLTQQFGAKDSLMILANEGLRVALVTEHIALSEVATAVTKERVAAKLKAFNTALVKDFGLEKPNIAVLALNPHAGDEGLMGDEESRVIRPAVIEAKKGGIMATGPFSADGFFGSGQSKKYDGILAMYHDQGLIPFKTMSFGSGVNFTAGLSQIRTSPDHGTGFDLAGKNMADPSSFRQSLYLAMDLFRNRKRYNDDYEGGLKKRPRLSEEDVE